MRNQNARRAIGSAPLVAIGTGAALMTQPGPPWVLMRALGIGFDEVLHPYAAADAQDFRKAAPAGKVPWLVDGETVVWDTLAIVEYLAERHTGVWPTNAAARAWARL